jgi:hypothetical protein
MAEETTFDLAIKMNDPSQYSEILVKPLTNRARFSNGAMKRSSKSLGTVT